MPAVQWTESRQSERERERKDKERVRDGKLTGKKRSVVSSLCFL